jgi:hypothetical protein
MGVEKEHVIIYGIRGDFHDFGVTEYVDDEKEYKHILNVAYGIEEHHRNNTCSINHPHKKVHPVCISDGYSGEYSIFGLLIEACGQDRWGEDRDLNMMLTINNLKKIHRQFLTLCRINKVDWRLYEDKIGLHAMTYYT